MAASSQLRGKLSVECPYETCHKDDNNILGGGSGSLIGPCVNDAHAWCKDICILKAQYGYLDEWYVRQELHLPRLSEYHGCMVDSILKSHEISVLNHILRGNVIHSLNKY